MEALKQTNDSFQWTFASKDMWTKGCSVGHTIKHHSFYNEMVSMLFKKFLSFIFFWGVCKGRGWIRRNRAEDILQRLMIDRKKQIIVTLYYARIAKLELCFCLSVCSGFLAVYSGLRLATSKSVPCEWGTIMVRRLIYPIVLWLPVSEPRTHFVTMK